MITILETHKPPKPKREEIGNMPIPIKIILQKGGGNENIFRWVKAEQTHGPAYVHTRNSDERASSWREVKPDRNISAQEWRGLEMVIIHVNRK